MRRTAALLVMAALATGCGSEDAPPKPNTIEAARQLKGFEPYWLGERFGGQTVVSAQVQMRRGQPGRGTMIDYGGRVGGIHTTDDPDARRLGTNVRMIERRGVPAAIAPRNRYAVLFTGRYTLMIGAPDRRALERAIAAVQPLKGPPRKTLPSPVGRVSGR